MDLDQVKEQIEGARSWQYRDWENLFIWELLSLFGTLSQWSLGKRSWRRCDLALSNLLQVCITVFEAKPECRTKMEASIVPSDQNAKRLQRSGSFANASSTCWHVCGMLVGSGKSQWKYVPLWVTLHLYLRPLLIGVGDITVCIRDEYIFTIFAMPVGNYFKGGLVPTNFLIQIVWPCCTTWYWGC